MASTPNEAEVQTDKAAVQEKVLLFGFDISKLSQRSQFALLGSGALICALTFAALQEKVFLIPDFKFSGFMTVLTTATYMLCAGIERVSLGDTKRKGAMKDYMLLSVFTFLGMYLTNWSLEYLTYPTRVMFKSSKVVPVMFASVIIVGRKYSMGEYFAAFVLVVGISMFTLADKGMPSFNFIGVFLITLGVIADAITCNFEESRFFRKLSCSQAEVVMFSSLFGLGISLATIVGTGELWPAVDHAMEHPEVLFYTLFFSAMGYCSVVFVLLLIKVFGSTNAEIVKSCRKVCSIVLSFMLYAKPVVWQHLLGGGLFVLSIIMTVQIKAARKKAAPYTAVPTDDPKAGNETVTV